MTEQLPLHGVAVYNPGLLNDEELRAYFVARCALLELFLDDLRRETPDHPPQHRLIVGTRGMGKTTLLRRLALAVREEPDLNTHWLPLTFPEEQYNIARLSDFWVNCLDALGDTLEQAGELALCEELDSCVDNLPDEEEPRAREALEGLLALSERLDRRLILLVDNLDIVFERLKKEHWSIREVLGHQPRLLLIGASARMLEETYEYDAAFYDFFKIHELKGLSEEEMTLVLTRLSEADNNTRVARMVKEEPARIRVLHTLTGGNPRTTVLLYGVLAQGIDGDVRSDLERLLDHCTPLYKARFEELPAQAQKIVDAMAINWDPLTAGTLAKQVRLPVNSVSTQLTRLEQQGIVQKVPLKPGCKSGFQIAERFFNIWYLMRTSRRVRRRLIWLVQFLKIFYNQQELQTHAQSRLQRADEMDYVGRLRHAEYCFSLAQAMDDGTMRTALENSALCCMVGDKRLRVEMKTLFDLDGEDAELKPRAERIQFMQELTQRVKKLKREWPEGATADEFAELLVGALRMTSTDKEQVLQSLLSLPGDELMERACFFRKEEQSWLDFHLENRELLNALRQGISSGLMENVFDIEGIKAAAHTLDCPLLSADADLKKIVQSPESLSPEMIARVTRSIEQYGLHYGWDYLGSALKAQGNLLGAIEAYRKQLDIKPNHEGSWNDLGCILGEQGDLEGAMDAFRKQLEVKLDHGESWNNLGIVLKNQGDLSGAIEAYRKQLEVKAGHGMGWCNLGNALEEQGDLSGAIEAYRKQLEVKPDHEWAWNSLGIALEDQGDLPGAIEAYRKQLEVKPDHGWAWSNLGIVLKRQGDLPGAIEVFRKQVEVKQDHGWAWHNLGNALREQGDLAGAIEAYRKQLEVKPDHMQAWNNLGSALQVYGDLLGAIEVFYQGMPHDSVGACHNNLAWLYYRQKQNLKEAEELAGEAVRLNPENIYAHHTLATLLAHNGDWVEAEKQARVFIEQGSEIFHEKTWDDTILFFREAVATGHAKEAAELLQKIEYADRWRPLHTALMAIVEGSDQLTQVAPEVRAPAEVLVEMLQKTP